MGPVVQILLVDSCLDHVLLHFLLAVLILRIGIELEFDKKNDYNIYGLNKPSPEKNLSI